ncbi:MAG: DUF3135 domain-containing protein [Gammaproteobacteria bacterium]
MPAHNNNTATCSFPKIDFDEWVSLARSDPEKFEVRRREIIESAIANNPPERQQRLRCLQWKIDQIRDRSPTPISAAVKISNMMWDSLTGPGGLKDSLSQVQQPTRLPQATVFELYPSKK